MQTFKGYRRKIPCLFGSIFNTQCNQKFSPDQHTEKSKPLRLEIKESLEYVTYLNLGGAIRTKGTLVNGIWMKFSTGALAC